MDRLGPRSSTDVDVLVGARVKALRRRNNLSQQGLGDVLGVTFQQVQKYEAGTNRLSVGRLTEMCAAFDVPPAYFFDPALSGKAVDPEHELKVNRFLGSSHSQDVMDCWPKLDGEGKTAVLSTMKAFAGAA